MTLYTRILRPLLFCLDPELAHRLTIKSLELAGAAPGIPALLRCYFATPDRSVVQVFGLEFANPLGLAAGYDKDGRALNGLACLGFGHLEVGTVTPQPQAGNPRPRIFRLPGNQALINRMGFPNAGARALLQNLQRTRQRSYVLGVNIGKGMGTPLEKAVSDYLQLFNTFYDVADYLAVNVSSPNTLGLRQLQERQSLDLLLGELEKARAERLAAGELRKPILIKLAPDLTMAELDDALSAIVNQRMDGVIATNTTIDRTGLHDPTRAESGGLSGAPLRERSTMMVRDIHHLTAGNLPIIATGGVFSAQDVKAKLDAGASLVQLYTGLVYHGPRLVKSILQELPTA